MTRRIIAVSADLTFAGTLAAAISDPGTQVVSDTDAGAALWVLDLDRATAPGRLAAVPSGARIIVVISRGTLADIVDVWTSDDRIIGCATDPPGAAALAKRALATAPPPAEALLAQGAALHTRTISDHDDKVRSLEEANGFAERRLKGRDAIRTAIEQTVDELLMNALYAAPVDASGRRVFAGVPVTRRAMQRTAGSVTLIYGADAARFALVVRDEFGTLDWQTVLRVLHKGLHAEDKVDAKTGGAGLGLFLIASTATAVHFDVSPGGRCEITCLFDVTGTAAAPSSLGFIARDPHTPARTASAEPSAATRRRRMRMAVGSVVATAVAAALVAAGFGPGTDQLAIRAAAGTAIEIDGTPAGIVGDSGVLVVPAGDTRHVVIARRAGHASQRVRVRAPHAITFDLAPVHAVALDSQPSGALVMDGDRVLGTTPLGVRAPRTLALDKPGYRRGTVQLDTTAPSKVATLERAPDLARVRITSNPPGAEVRRGDEGASANRTFTPADVYVKAGERHRFTLVMPAHAPLVVEVAGTEGEVAGGDLVPEP